MALKVLVADPHPFFRDALSCGLRGLGVDVVASTSDELEAVELAGAAAPDIALTEVELDAGSGLSLARRLQGMAKVVLLTRARPGDILLDAVDAGAVGCLGHDLKVGELAAVLRSSSSSFLLDERSLLETLKRASAIRDFKLAGQPALGRLSAREREVLRLLARGLDNEEIAANLYLSPNTVRTHVGNILKKLDVHSRADAARVAFEAERVEGDKDVLRIAGPNLSGS